jgi:hypothetical protein
MSTLLKMSTKTHSTTSEEQRSIFTENLKKSVETFTAYVIDTSKTPPKRMETWQVPISQSYSTIAAIVTTLSAIESEQCCLHGPKQIPSRPTVQFFDY